MAQEAVVSASLGFTKGNVSLPPWVTGEVGVSAGTSPSYRGVQFVSTSEETLILGGVTPGLLAVLNLDSPGSTESYVVIRTIAGNVSSNAYKLKAGEFMLIRAARSAYYIQAVGGAVSVETLALPA
jgi:hypothetical protein